MDSRSQMKLDKKYSNLAQHSFFLAEFRDFIFPNLEVANLEKVTVL